MYHDVFVTDTVEANTQQQPVTLSGPRHFSSFDTPVNTAVTDLTPLARAAYYDSLSTQLKKVIWLLSHTAHSRKTGECAKVS